jgi:hypothetical protein
MNTGLTISDITIGIETLRRDHSREACQICNYVLYDTFTCGHEEGFGIMCDLCDLRNFEGETDGENNQERRPAAASRWAEVK